MMKTNGQGKVADNFKPSATSVVLACSKYSNEQFMRDFCCEDTLQ